MGVVVSAQLAGYLTAAVLGLAAGAVYDLLRLIRLRRRRNRRLTHALDGLFVAAVTLTAAPKGFGLENMSRLWMLTPAQGIEGVKECIVETVRLAGGNPCPPVVVGVGIGGTAECAMLMAKHSLTRECGEPSPDPMLAQMEQELLARINDLGIGPQGLGGRVTALAVHIEQMPTHIAGLPVAVNMQCHAARHKTATI